jgi:branched-chain amino acid transport system substrate-binding protein
MGVTAAVAAGEQFLPVLVTREGAVRSFQAPRADGYIAYLTLLNKRDGGINGVKLVWEECETVFDATRTVECYERLKTKGPTGAAVFHPHGTQWTVLTDWMAPDQALVRPLVEAAAARYAQDKGITPRTCP